MAALDTSLIDDPVLNELREAISEEALLGVLFRLGPTPPVLAVPALAGVGSVVLDTGI